MKNFRTNKAEKRPDSGLISLGDLGSISATFLSLSFSIWAMKGMGYVIRMPLSSCSLIEFYMPQS